MRIRDGRGSCPLRSLLPALAVIGIAAGASADSGEFEEEGFGRKGFYVGIGASFGFPMDWTGELQSGMTRTANDTAEANAEDPPPGLVPPGEQIDAFEPITIAPGVDFDRTRFGFGGMVGYRVSGLAALELEGEWLADAGRENFTIEPSGATGTAALQELWTLTANLRVYPFSGRFQPFGVFGAGLIHSRFDASTQNLTTPALVSDGSTVVLPADFQVQNTQLDGMIRVGLGIDTYLTESLAAELKSDYVIPFADNEFVSTQYLSLRVGLLYRF